MLGESFVFLPVEKPYVAPPIGVAIDNNAKALDKSCPDLTPLQRHFVEQLEGSEGGGKNTIK